jgi:FAD:protein FMN transferase
VFGIFNRRALKTEPFIKHGSVMNTVVYQKVYGINGAIVAENVSKELQRIDSLWSPTRTGNIIYQIRKSSGTVPLSADKDTVNVCRQAKIFGALSRGTFDITSDPLIRLWRDAAQKKLPPPPDEVKNARDLVCIGDLQIGPDETISLARKGQGINLGGIGKGYAADRCREIYQNAGVKHAVINIGGNVLVINSKPDGSPWRIGIKDPLDTNGRLIGFVEAFDCSVVTSGDYERYFDYTDTHNVTKRFHHILNPQTGYPAETNIASVTVMADSSCRCDALSTAAFVLGVDEGRRLCSLFDNTDALFISKNGSIEMTEGMAKKFIKG